MTTTEEEFVEALVHQIEAKIQAFAELNEDASRREACMLRLRLKTSQRLAEVDLLEPVGASE
ncbi:MAG: hypothetical protein N2C14_17810 [Planctomycetales bacterium]